MNLNRVESRQKASVMFEPFRVTAMRTPRSWAKGHVPGLATAETSGIFLNVRLRIQYALQPFTSEAQPRSLATDRDQVILSC